MRRRALLPVLLAALAASAAGAAETGTVVQVVDGDTLKVALGGRRETIRLIGVDTPETVHPQKPDEHFGKEASAFTRRAALGQLVRLEDDAQDRNRDKYGRLLRYVFLPDGKLLNAEIIVQGYGHAYTRFPFARLEEFRVLEREAREASRGLWGPSGGPAGAGGPPQQAGPAGGSSAGPPLAPAGAQTPAGHPIGPGDGTTSTPRVAAADDQKSGGDDPAVYVTRTGTRYHRAGCRYLARSRIPVALKDAAARYAPCSVCGPPTLSPSRASVTAPGAGATGTARSASASSRCQATTKKGAQCKRSAAAGSRYCWQHGG